MKCYYNGNGIEIKYKDYYYGNKIEQIKVPVPDH